MSQRRYRPSEQSRPDSLQSGGTRATETPNNTSQESTSSNSGQDNQSAAV